MKDFHTAHNRFLKSLIQQFRQETLQYVKNGMEEQLGSASPDEQTLWRYLQNPQRQTSLTSSQQLVAMDLLLEWTEINFRTCCDLLRYQMLRQNGVVDSVEEFLQLLQKEAE